MLPSEHLPLRASIAAETMETANLSTSGAAAAAAAAAVAIWQTWKVSDAAIVNLGRLSRTLRLPNLVSEFEDHFSYAAAAFHRSPHGAYVDAWISAVKTTQMIRGALHPSEDLLCALQRFECFAPSTSKIESSFSKVAFLKHTQ